MVERARQRQYPEQFRKKENPPNLTRELELMRIVDPHILEDKIRMQASTFGTHDQAYVDKAFDIVKDLYQGKQRKFSPTAAILHPYRVTLGSENKKPHSMIIKLLHDTEEDYDLSELSLRKTFGEMGPVIAKGVSALTRKKGESYAAYLERLRLTAEGEPDLADLMDDKAADMINNCLDPFGLPASIERKQHTITGMKTFLDKIDTHAEAFFVNRPDLLDRVSEAVAQGRAALEHPELRIV